MPVNTLPNVNSTYLLVAVEEVPGLGRHPLLRRTKRRESYTVWIKDNAAYASSLPLNDDLRAADKVFTGGSDHTVSGTDAQRIYNAGFGSWLTLVSP